MTDDTTDVRRVSRVEMGSKALEWRLKAIDNVEKWGLQSIESIMLDTDEVRALASQARSCDECGTFIKEWGEFVQAYHEGTYENDEGKPLDEQQPLDECTDEQLDRMEEELADTAALLFQAQAAIDRARDDTSCEQHEALDAELDW